MAGLFGRASKDPAMRENLERKRNLRKLVRAKEYDKALGTGEAYLKGAPHDHDVLFVVGSIHYMNKRYETALSYLDRALDIGAYDVDALLLKANSHYLLGQTKHARRCCSKILEVDEKNRGVKELAGKLDHHL